MAVGADNFADAPVFVYGGNSDPTPSAPLTVEPGDPTTENGVWDDGAGEVYHVNRTAWWKFTAPATETVGIDLFQSIINLAAPNSLTDYDPVVHVFTGTSLSTLNLVAEGDDNDRPNNPDGTVKYAYLTEMDFEAVQDTTYYVRVGLWEWSSDMDLVLRLGKRVYVYQDWVERPDVFLAWPSDTPSGWDDTLVSEVPRLGPIGGQQSYVTHLVYPWSGNYYTITPANVTEAVNTSVAQVAAATVLHPMPLDDPLFGAGLAVQAETRTTSRPDIPPPTIFGPFPQDRHLYAASSMYVERHRPTHGTLFRAAAPTPPSDPESLGIEYMYPNPNRFIMDDEGNMVPDPRYPRDPTISRDLILSFTSTAYAVTFEPDPIHYDTPMSMNYEVLTGYTETSADFIVPDTDNVDGYPDLDLSNSTVVGNGFFTSADQSIPISAPLVPNGCDIDGSFVLVSRVLSIADVGSHGGTNQGFWQVPHFLTSFTADYTISNISPYRYVYPTITGGSEEKRWFVAHDSTWHATDPVVAHGGTWHGTNSDQARLGSGVGGLRVLRAERLGS
jgi:hypothetical protein